MKISDDMVVIIAAVGVVAFLFWDARRSDTSHNGDDVMITSGAAAPLPTGASGGAGVVLQEVAQAIGVITTNSIPVIP